MNLRMRRFTPILLVTTLGGWIILSALIFPRAVRATDGGGAWAQATAYITKEYGLDTVARFVARKFFDIAVGQLRAKIQKGGRKNGPAFVEKWGNFQTNAQYRGEDVFRAILANTKTCKYLESDINQIFGVTSRFRIPLGGQNIRVGDLDPFTLRAKCTLPDNFSVEKYRQDFKGNGGWDAFLRLMQPQNNFYGLLLQSTDELEKQRALEISSDVQEAAAGGGYTALRSACTKIAGTTKCAFLGQIGTPADLVGKTAATLINKELEWLTNADELSEVFIAIVTTLTSRFNNLSIASSNPSIERDTEETEKMEYCTAQSPRNSIIKKYIGKFNPYGTAKTKSGDYGDGPCGDPNSNEYKENPYIYQLCVQYCLKALGVLPSDLALAPLPTNVPLKKVSPSPKPTTPTPGTSPTSTPTPNPGCVETTPLYEGDVASAIDTLVATQPGLFNPSRESRGGGTPIGPGAEGTMSDLEAYKSALNTVLQGRGYTSVNHPTDSFAIALWKTSDFRETYKISYSWFETRHAYSDTCSPAQF